MTSCLICSDGTAPWAPWCVPIACTLDMLANVDTSLSDEGQGRHKSRWQCRCWHHRIKGDVAAALRAIGATEGPRRFTFKRNCRSARVSSESRRIVCDSTTEPSSVPMSMSLDCSEQPKTTSGLNPVVRPLLRFPEGKSSTLSPNSPMGR